MMDAEKLEQFTQNLIVGSQVLDRKEREIQTVISMIVALVREEPLDVVSDVHKMEMGPSEWWCLKRSKDGILIEYYRDSIRALEADGTSRHPHSPLLRMQMKDVAVVRAALPWFVKMMKIRFPDLRTRTQPFVDAANSGQNPVDRMRLDTAIGAVLEKHMTEIGHVPRKELLHSELFAAISKELDRS